MPKPYTTCFLRKVPVVLTPEEYVRQNTLATLLSLGYPKSGIVVEKKISQLPNIVASAKPPYRRVDILIYLTAEGCYTPFLLIECKRKLASFETTEQLLGYNHFIGAAFIAVIDEEKTILAPTFQTESFFPFTKGLPEYKTLLSWYRSYS